MQRSDIIRVLGIMIAIALVIFAVIQIAKFARNSDGNSPSTAPADEGLVLSEFATGDSEVIMTRVGAIVAPEDHRQIRVSVSQHRRRLEIFSGYDGRVLTRRTFDNTPESYRTFLAAINHQGFLLLRETPDGDGLGVCSSGRQVTFELINNQEDLARSWATSCDKAEGSSDGNVLAMRRLFQKQIPNYDQLTENIDLIPL